ncbi:MAG: hypothetical protein JW715_00740 [Sedimentisphaerales bacterium]|nr:hypothetical protein [Sedimentisphaerales bacterium]
MKTNTMYISIISLLLIGSQAFSQKLQINRYDLVKRHNVVIEELNPLSPLAVGNGDFAFTADITGLQTFGDYYYKNGVPLETLSNHFWHSFPNTENLTLEDAEKEYDFHGGKVFYASLEKSPAGQYFRKNPHRIPLGQLGLVLSKADGSAVRMEDLKNIRQELDLWTAVLQSRYQIEDRPVLIETICHPGYDMVAVKIKSPLIAEGRLKPRIRFPYSYDASVKNKPPFDWSNQDLHETKILKQTPESIQLERILDDSRYYVKIEWTGINRIEQRERHDFIFEPAEVEEFSFVCAFSKEAMDNKLPSFESAKKACAASWENYWTKGGIIDFSGSTDPRANELERRVILSLYQVKMQYSGSFPPQESGLTHISWYGKHNTEMYLWHVSHFAQWGRIELLEKSLAWFQSILPQARELAKKLGVEGARWPKMTGIDGRQSPGSINPFIIWNQPNLIYVSELCYRAHPDRQTLEKYKDLVFESADFLASYAYYDEKADRYNLGPPVKNVSEDTAENNTKNPTFELAYWHYGLSTAQKWRQRLGMPRNPKWDEVLQKLAPLPVQDGLYLEIETEPDIYRRGRGGPTSMLMALGFLPEGTNVDKEIMRRTFQRVVGGDRRFSSWGAGSVAMTAIRLGETDVAIDILCGQRGTNRYMPNGLVPRPKEPMNCPAYLPVNCSFLSAVALMATGWDDAEKTGASGFPSDGGWNVRWEGLQRLP